MHRNWKHKYWKTSLPLHQRSRSSACWSWDNGYKRTWALLFSSDWVTILPACRMQLVKEIISWNAGTYHPSLPPARSLEAHPVATGILEDKRRWPWNSSLTCFCWLRMTIAGQKLPNIMVRMHSWVVGSWWLPGEDGKTFIPPVWGP